MIGGESPSGAGSPPERLVLANCLVSTPSPLQCTLYMGALQLDTVYPREALVHMLPIPGAWQGAWETQARVQFADLHLFSRTYKQTTYMAHGFVTWNTYIHKCLQLHGNQGRVQFADLHLFWYTYKNVS